MDRMLASRPQSSCIFHEQGALEILCHSGQKLQAKAKSLHQTGGQLQPLKNMMKLLCPPPPPPSIPSPPSVTPPLLDPDAWICCFHYKRRLKRLGPCHGHGHQHKSDVIKNDGGPCKIEEAKVLGAIAPGIYPCVF